MRTANLCEICVSVVYHRLREDHIVLGLSSEKYNKPAGQDPACHAGMQAPSPQRRLWRKTRAERQYKQARVPAFRHAPELGENAYLHCAGKVIRHNSLAPKV